MSTARCLPVLTLLALTALAGCQGSGFGESVTVPQGRQQSYGQGPDLRALSLPADQPFNVVETQRQSRDAGTAESSAETSGTAFCRAATGAGGAAWAEFRIGHVLHQDGDRPVESTIAFDVDYEFAAQASTTEAGPDLAALKLFVQDSNRRTLGKVFLFERRGGNGPQASAARERPVLHVTLEPGLVYHLIVAGRVEVGGNEPPAEVEAQIKLNHLSIEVLPKPADR